MRSKHCSLVAVGCLIECLLKWLSDHLALFTFFIMFLRKRNSGDRGNGNVGGGGGNTVTRWWLWLNGRDGGVVVLIRKCFLPLKCGSRFFSLLTFILHCIELHKIQKMFWCFFFFWNKLGINPAVKFRVRKALVSTSCVWCLERTECEIFSI